MARKKSKAAATSKQREEPEVDDDVASTSSSDAEEEAADGDSGSGSDSGSEQESDGQGDDVNSSNDDGDSSSGDEEESADEEEGDDDEKRSQTADDANTNNNSEQCTFDLYNLLALNTHQINAAELYQPNGNKKALNPEWYSNELPTIPANSTNQQLPQVNEAFLLSKAAEGTAQLLQELWKLPTEKTDVGQLARLPSAETKLPRSLVSIIGTDTFVFHVKLEYVSCTCISKYLLPIHLLIFISLLSQIHHMNK